MKKSIYILSIVLSATLFSCNDLDVVPIGQISDGNFPKSDADAIAVTSAVYQPNVGISTALGYLIDLTSELETNGENPNSAGALLATMDWYPDNGYVASVWNALYNTITRANDVVDKIGPSEIVTPTLKTRLLGEAKFLRAYAYFYLVQLWGEVPLVLHNIDGDKVPRTAINDVYAQIVSDLKDAADGLPVYTDYAAADRGRASKGAALGYLSKVYLVWGQTDNSADVATRKERFTESVRYADLVTGYSLEETFLDNWNNNNRNGKEVLFSVQHLQGQVSGTSGGNHLVHCSFYGGFSNVTDPHVFSTSNYERDLTQEKPPIIPSTIVNKWHNDFDDRDQRKNGTYLKEYRNPDGNHPDSVFVFNQVRYRKYIDTTHINTTAATIDVNRTVIRYAEVLLLKAEAINERDGTPNAEAYEAINQVRRRAFRQPLGSASALADIPAGLDYNSFKARIQQERVFELTYEQNRWTDLVRWRIYVQTLKESVSKGYVAEELGKQNVQKHYYRFPIPKAERDIDPIRLWQNYGYDGSTVTENPYRNYEPGWTD
ncbi:MAG: RagB/SusD family nutrient uptake outer membrane protein [Dysgonamonadaceae bacterium]|jgi:hypothetical protein|nr:RagB/SusD family nutrient uptake outer membrane protein [Dysgonamonadaceae bacterium]